MKINIDEIIVPMNRRRVDSEKVRQLAESIREIGLLNPITVTKEKRLVAGAHRLEAVKLNGETEIEVKIVDGDDLHLELTEIDENLIRNELDPISVGELAIRRDEILGALGLRAKVGGDGSNQHKSNDAPGAPLLKTTESIAGEIGVSKRSLQENKQLARDLVPEAKEIVRKGDVRKKDALKLARMPVERQIEIVGRIQTGEAKTVKEAELIDARQKVKQQSVSSVQNAPPTVFIGDGIQWIEKQEPCDLLLTDPPYSTEVTNIEEFAQNWLPVALAESGPRLPTRLESGR